MSPVERLIESWNDARLALEVEQAMAAMEDPRHTDEFRHSAMVAAALMANEILRRKERKEERP